MKIWHLDCDVDNFENLILKDKADLELLKSFDGRNLKEGWVPAKVDRMYNREFSDSPGFASHVPVFGKRVVRFTEYAFDPKKVCEKNIFKICEESLKRPFVSDEFRNKILNSQLSGFKFELVWEGKHED